MLRSLLFLLFQIVVTPFFSILSIATFPLPLRGRYWVISKWARMMIAVARVLCGIRYRVIGREHLPPPPYIILSNHQSAWETMFFQIVFPPQVWVLKRELLWIPFFGWGLAMLQPIAIDRSSGARALRQTYEQGSDRLARGFCIVIFPEGTRTAPGESRPFQPGGAWLAAKTGVPVVPVAHNAGACWPKHAWLKTPGVVTVSIGQPVMSDGLTASEINARAESWIRAEIERLGTHAAT